MNTVSAGQGRNGHGSRSSVTVRVPYRAQGSAAGSHGSVVHICHRYGQARRPLHLHLVRQRSAAPSERTSSTAHGIDVARRSTHNAPPTVRAGQRGVGTGSQPVRPRAGQSGGRTSGRSGRQIPLRPASPPAGSSSERRPECGAWACPNRTSRNRVWVSSEGATPDAAYGGEGRRQARRVDATPPHAHRDHPREGDLG